MSLIIIFSKLRCMSVSWFIIDSSPPPFPTIVSLYSSALVEELSCWLCSDLVLLIVWLVFKPGQQDIVAKTAAVNPCFVFT